MQRYACFCGYVAHFTIYDFIHLKSCMKFWKNVWYLCVHKRRHCSIKQQKTLLFPICAFHYLFYYFPASNADTDINELDGGNSKCFFQCKVKKALQWISLESQAVIYLCEVPYKEYECKFIFAIQGENHFICSYWAPVVENDMFSFKNIIYIIYCLWALCCYICTHPLIDPPLRADFTLFCEKIYRHV